MNYIELNKFSELHDGKNIFFCKIDYILNDFKTISEIKNDVVLITGNSDYAIDGNLLKMMPSNIKKWYGQNVLANDPRIVPIPMGIENKLESYRKGHGIGYFDRVDEKEKLLNRLNNVTPTKKIYANFNLNTNYQYRSIIKNICVNAEHITWEESNLSLSNFFDRILDYECIVCPIGNGIDTHRLWETLYSKRIPITIKAGDYGIYKLYEKFPIIVLNNVNDLMDYELILEKILKIKNTKYDENLLSYDYWLDIIKTT